MPGKTAIVALLVGALLGGCGSAEPAPTSPRPGPSAELVAWVDGVCQVLRESTWNPPPPVATTGVTEADRPAIVAYLDAAHDHFTQMVAKIDALPAAPVDGGDEVVANMRSKLDGLAIRLDRYEGYASLPQLGHLMGSAYRDGVDTVSSWGFGSPTLADLAKKDPLVAEAQQQVC
jgi:hypothetical protein